MIDKYQAKRNVKVRINDDLSKTSKRFGVSPTMQLMKGKFFPIDRVYKSSYSDSFSLRIDGYDFDPNDVTLLSLKKKKAKKFHFDIEELNI
jgi:hypothetical protein